MCGGVYQRAFAPFHAGWGKTQVWLPAWIWNSPISNLPEFSDLMSEQIKGLLVVVEETTQNTDFPNWMLPFKQNKILVLPTGHIQHQTLS